MILPVALAAGMLQILVPSPRSGTGAPDDGHGQVSASNAPRAIDGTASAQEVERRAPPASIRIVIHHAVGAENTLPAIQLAAFLQEQGFEVTDIRPVDAELERPSVRHSYDGDQPDTRPLIDAVAAFFSEGPDQVPEEVADFGAISPGTRQGDIEVWLPAPASGAREPT